MKHILGTIICLFVCPQFIMSQIIKGETTDSKGNPLESVNVVLLSLKDTSFIDGSTTDSIGVFSINTKGQSGFLRFSMIGYKTHTEILNKCQDVKVLLEEDKNILSEVTIKGELPKTRLSGEGMITTVTGSILEKTSSMEHLLNYIPKVSVTNGEINVFGRGVPEIYINGRKIVNQADLMHLQSSDIKNIEVITNPGARYNASVKSVIRIITKKNAEAGWGVDANQTLGINEQKRFSLIDNFTIKYHKDRFDLSGTLYGDYTHRQDDKQIHEFMYLQNIWQQTSSIKQEYTRLNPYARLSLNYLLDENNSIGASVSWDRYAKNNGEGTMEAIVMSDDTAMESSQNAYESLECSTSVSTNAYYVGKFGKFDVDFNIDYYWNDMTNKMNNNGIVTENGDNSFYEEVDSKRDNNSHQLASKLVLSSPFAWGMFSLGSEYSGIKRKSKYIVLPDNIVDNEFSTVKEDMLSIFCDYNMELGKMTTQIGLRYEYVNFDYYNHDEYIPEQSKKYDNFFPSIALSYTIGKIQMQFTYASDISRPSYYQLRNGVQYDNRYTYESGNPFLLPSISRNLEYDLSWRWFSLSILFSHNTNSICSIMRPYNNNEKTTMMCPENMDPYNEMGTTFLFSPSFGIWHPELETSIYKQWFYMDTQNGKSLCNPIGVFRLKNTFDMKWMTAFLILNAQTDGNTGNVWNRSYWGANISLYKALYKRRLVLQLDAKDLFGTMDRLRVVYSGRQRTTYMKAYSSSSITFTMKYKFNAAKDRYKGTGAGKQQRRRL